MNDPVKPPQKNARVDLDSVVIRFAGDSGDGMQLTGQQFSIESAFAGNDIATLPDFPAEIRAPAGSLAGVSGFQVHFGHSEVYSPGDNPDVLVAMNPAALSVNIKDLQEGAILILNEDAFTEKNLERAGFTKNPCHDRLFSQRYRLFSIPISRLTKETLVGSNLSPREVERCKNFFTLGVMLWMFNRPAENTKQWISEKFGKDVKLRDANLAVLEAGISFADSTEIFDVSYDVKPAKQEPGVYRNINGTTALAYGLLAAATKSELPLFFGAYPITPASDLLHELARHKRFGVISFQAEDEISAICSAVGASFAGALAITSTSGPGMALKTEALGLAVIAELPLVVINTQRGGPSTGLPTKTEQSDLFQALFGRHGEAPVCVIAASSAETAFTLAYDACRIAIKYMTPVVLLSDGFIANSSAPWKIVDLESLPAMDLNPRLHSENVSQTTSPLSEKFQPYSRNPLTLARPWAVPGMAGFEHRIGGLEKENLTGEVSYDSDNHHLMSSIRAEKIKGIIADVPQLEIDGEPQGDLLVVGWGGTEGSLQEAVKLAREEGLSVSRIHLHYLNPLPANLESILKSFRLVLAPEINLGQLRFLLRSLFLIDVHGLNIMRGQPLLVKDVMEKIRLLLVQPGKKESSNYSTPG